MRGECREACKTNHSSPRTAVPITLALRPRFSAFLVSSTRLVVDICDVVSLLLQIRQAHGIVTPANLCLVLELCVLCRCGIPQSVVALRCVLTLFWCVLVFQAYCCAVEAYSLSCYCIMCPISFASRARASKASSGTSNLLFKFNDVIKMCLVEV